MYCTMYRGTSETTKELRLKLRKTGYIFLKYWKILFKKHYSFLKYGVLIDHLKVLTPKNPPYLINFFPMNNVNKIWTTI